MRRGLADAQAALKEAERENERERTLRTRAEGVAQDALAMSAIARGRPAPRGWLGGL